MRHDALANLRSALLLALGLGGCTSMPAGDRGDDGKTPPGDVGADGATAKTGETRPDAKPGKTGYIRESDGSVHRAGAQACSPANDRPACSDPGERGHGCKTDAECKDGPHARCVQDSGQIGQYCRCDYACASDSDCKQGEVCVCGDALGGNHHSQCVPAKCKSDAECGDRTCGLSVYFNGCSEAVTLACHTDKDTCKTDADCTNGEDCALNADSGAWTCQPVNCAIGRPLLVEGAARTAPTAQRSDWLADLELEADVSPPLAAALCERWTAVAALEHASVASFARFTLELLAHAAPPDLVADAQRAALDEIEHAKLAWSLASLWSERPLGPGPLAMGDVVVVRPLEDMVVALVKEACVGETLGAAEACALADAAGHPTLAAVLENIASDEQRHAALAWRTLRWLLATHGERVRLAALVAAAEAEAELRAELTRPEVELVEPAWGLLGHDTLLARRREAFHEVVRPLLRATLGRPADA